MATSLYEVKDVGPWNETFQLYDKILKLKAEKEKKKRKATKLLELDNWFQNQLPQEINKRSSSEKFLTQEELIKLMEWKLTNSPLHHNINTHWKARSGTFKFSFTFIRTHWYSVGSSGLALPNWYRQTAVRL
ncbi:hypothetical protein OS493_018002 [Desmophyllum pertusum]|uniref:Uncharacterized protein n=1 Tax=Desmophyllum pertusum TaxID=174260 RepID=A0A9W9Z2X5_9CNID|nr:hypothetical protein OS493_018002 [Desmophyllum pertusum]